MVLGSVTVAANQKEIHYFNVERLILRASRERNTRDSTNIHHRIRMPLPAPQLL